jgi:hypothetical protein
VLALNEIDVWDQKICMLNVRDAHHVPHAYVLFWPLSVNAIGSFNIQPAKYN